MYNALMKAFAFVDASNLFYGGEKSLGWKIDYQKLINYLSKKYNVSEVFYFGGVEIHGFAYDYLKHDTVPLGQLEGYLVQLLGGQNHSEISLLKEHIQRVRFYKNLERFGYKLYIKPVKFYKEGDLVRKKANCDVDMAFCLMKEKDNFGRAVVLSGDGDFLPVLKYLRSAGKEIIILARGPRTAKEIKKFAGANFRDFVRLENLVRLETK